MWVKYNQNYFYLCPFFGNSPTGQTRRWIFTHDGSNDADSRKDVPFGVFYIALNLGGQKTPKTPNLGAWIGELEKRGYYQNYCTDSDQILHSDKDHQMHLVGGPHTRITNPRWRTAAILDKSKNRHISV